MIERPLAEGLVEGTLEVRPVGSPKKLRLIKFGMGVPLACAPIRHRRYIIGWIWSHRWVAEHFLFKIAYHNIKRAADEQDRH